MTNPKTLRRHAELVDRMSRVVGLDLEEELMRGQMQIDTLGDAVLRCTGCSNAHGCDHWLAAQEGEADAPPEYCRNTEIFEALKAGKRV
ncbi:MAG: DUF6455 family protein [Roseovarius sp.]|nr:DUF6455 family protein [Roseovarius sp.]